MQCPKCTEASTLSWVLECDNGHEFAGPELQNATITTGADNHIVETGLINWPPTSAGHPNG